MPETPIGAGTTLAGRFRLEDLIEETDGAKFWRATDQTLARNVAVHVIDAADPRADALLNAARASATVSDVHLLRVLDAAVEDDVVYVVNEWGSGVSLDRLLVEGPLGARRAAWVVKEVAEAISTAHRHGVAHGRLVPENVMVTEAGSVKLIGFVIDAVLNGRRRPAPDGEPISDHESDVLNLGALLYAALAGKWPGPEPSTVPTAPLDHGRLLRPRQVRAGVPRPLDAICDRVLSPEHAHGPAIETAHEIFAALSDFIGDPTGAAHMGLAPTDTAVTAAIDAGTGDPEATQAGVPVFEDAATVMTGELHRDAGSPADRPAESRPENPDETTAGSPAESPAESTVGWLTPRADAPPPPPDLPEPEPKPLFAAGPWPGRAAAAGGARAATDTETRTGSAESTGDHTPGRHSSWAPGPRNGSLPPTWGPDVDPSPPDGGQWHDGSWDEERQPGRRWLRLAAGIAGLIVLVVAVVFAFNLGRNRNQTTPSAGGSSHPPSASPAPSKPLAFRAVTDFDPEGDGSENPSEVPLATDGNPGTAWNTLTYYGNPKLGGLKSGVGLLVDLGKPRRLGSVSVSFGSSPTSVQILAAPGTTSPPTSTTGLKQVAADRNAGSKADLKLAKPVTTRWFVVWLTSLPQVSGGYRGAVAEVSARS